MSYNRNEQKCQFVGFCTQMEFAIPYINFIELCELL